MIRVLHITEWFPHTGDVQLGIFVQKQIQALVHHTTLEHCVLQIAQGTNKMEVIQLDGYRVIRLSATKGLKGKVYFLTKLREFTKHGYTFKPDIIHVHAATGKAMIVAGFFKNPLVISEHWSGFMRLNSEEIPVKRLNYLKKAKKVIVPSSVMKQRLDDIIDIKNVEVVSNVIECVQHQIPKEENVLRMVCDFDDENKRITQVIRCFGEIVSESKEFDGFRLEIIGDGPDKENIASCAKNVKGVTLRGRLEPSDTLHAIATASFVIVNSKVETFSMVALEALLAGTPLLATKTGVIESFWMGNPGRLTDSGHSLIDDMKDMMRHYKEFDTALSCELIKKYCSAESVALELESLYNSLT